MACFVAPMAVAVVTTVLKKKIPYRLQPGRLALMLWASVVALMVDHAISGELSIYPPFLTALETPAQTAMMLHEITVTGTLMTVAVFALWGATLVVDRLRRPRGSALGQH